MNLLDELMAYEQAEQKKQEDMRAKNENKEQSFNNLEGHYPNLVVNIKLGGIRKNGKGSLVSTATILDGEHLGKTLPYWVGLESENLKSQSEGKKRVTLDIFSKIDALNGRKISTMLKQGREIDEQSVMDTMDGYTARVKVNHYNGKNNVSFVSGASTAVEQPAPQAQPQAVEDPWGNDPF